MLQNLSKILKKCFLNTGSGLCVINKLQYNNYDNDYASEKSLMITVALLLLIQEYDFTIPRNISFRISEKIEFFVNSW